MSLPPLIVVGDPYKKEHLDYPDNLCLIPWTGFSNNPNGTVRPCCLYGENIKDESGNDMYVQQNTLKEIFGSKHMKDLREAFRENKKPSACNTCWIDEKNNRKSKRLTYNNEVYESLKEVDIDWRTEPDIPFEYQMIISNSCNLKCRSCTPSHSSQWMLEHEKYHGKGNTGYDLPHGQAGDKEGILWKDRHSWYPKLKRLEVVGGEPMYIKQWHQMFDELIQLGYAKDIVLDMSTNANILLKDKLIYWADNFKRVGVGLSVDGLEKTYDYMRKLGEWETVLNNMEIYHDLATYYKEQDVELHKQLKSTGCKLNVQVSFTLSWLNALDLPRMHKLVEERFPNFRIWNNLVHYPEWMSLRYAPQDMKDYISSVWDKRDWKEYEGDIQGMQDFMDQPTVDEETFKYFYSKNMFLDNHRKEDFLQVVPEYKPFLEKYITKNFYGSYINKYKDEPYGPTNSIPMVLLNE